MADKDGRNLLSTDTTKDKTEKEGKNLLPSDDSVSSGKYKPTAERLKEVLSSGVTGGVLGAFTPEILMGVGTALEVGAPFTGPAMPLVEAAGIASTATGRVMRGSRGAQAGYGVLGGLSAGTAKEVGEARGWSPGATFTAELVAGGFGPELAPIATKAFQKIAGGLTGLSTRDTVESAFNSIKQSIEGQTGKPLTSEQSKFIQGKLEQIRGGARTPESAQKSFDIIKKGVEQESKAAQLQAERLRTQAKVRAPEQERAIKAAETERTQLGKTKDSDTIGRELRDKITAKQKTKIDARKKQFDADNKIVQDEVGAKESSGVYIENDPQTKAIYDKIVSDLRNKLLIGKQALTQKTAQVTEPGVISQLDRVYNALNKQKRLVGSDEFGNPVYKEFPVSFNAIDDLRRKLGDAAFGKVAEGYEAIGASNARELYKALSELQASFAPAKRELISNYEAASQELNIFKTATGKKATAVEKFDPERFKTDPASLPNTYFKTPQSVTDLIELTGDKKLVEELGGSYLSQQFEGKSAKQVQDIINKNLWISKFPQLESKVMSFKNALAKAEGLPTAEKVLATAETEAGKIEQAAEQKAKQILGDKNAVARMADIISGKSSEILQPKVAQYIIKSPQGRQQFTKAVGTLLADASPATIKKVFTDNVKPALQASKIVDQTEIARLESLVNEIDKTMTGQEKINRIVKIINQALLGSVAAGTSPYTSPIYGGILSKMSPF